MYNETKLTILLCWGYHRKGWIEIFESLKDKFDFHYLYWISKESEPASYTSCDIHYWSEFSSAQEIIRKIQPDKVIFMGTNSLLVLSLLFECKQKYIPTYTMQHGMFHDLKTNLYLDEKMEKNALMAESKKKYQIRFSTIKFFLHSFRMGQIPYVIPIFKWLRDRKKMLPLAAWAKHKAKYRETDFYIVYTKFNGNYFTEVDGIKEDKMISIGVPEFDKFFEYHSGSKKDTNEVEYNLLIDSALTSIYEFKTNGVLSQQSYNDFILKIDSLSREQNRKLYVKLHPYCYANTNFVKNDNITYFYDCDIVDLIMNAATIFGFDSTLVLPSVYFKKTILFALHTNSYFQNNIRAIMAAPVLDYFSFDIQDLKKALAFTSNDDARKLLKERFLFDADSNTKSRVEEILKS